MCQLRASDFVECVDNKPIHKQTKTMPELGRLYTIESVRSVSGGFSVRLNELTPDCYKGGSCTCGNCGWDASRFRKVYRPEEWKLASLRALLDVPAGQPVAIDGPPLI